MHDTAIAIALIGLLIFAAHLFEIVFKQTRIPDVLPLVIIGLILGPLLGIATPTSFGAVGPVFTIITFIFILFEAGIGLKIASLIKAYKETLILGIVSFIATVIIIGIAAMLLTDLGIVRSLILACVVGGTSSAIVAPILRQLNMQTEGKTVLLLESTINDVLCILSTLSLIEIAKIGNFSQFDIGLTTGKVVATFTLSVMIGMVGAFGWSVLLDKVRNLQNSIFSTAAFVFIIFGLTEWLGFSGALASLTFGITLGNISAVSDLLRTKENSINPSELNYSEKTFFAEIVFILKTFFFVYIGISLQFANWEFLLIGAALTAIIYIVRIPVVRFTISKTTPVLDLTMLATVISRGLAAAVLASLPFQKGIYGGDTIQSIAYSIILFSIILTSSLVFLVEKGKLFKFYNWVFKTRNN